MLAAIFKITKPRHVVFSRLLVGVPTALSASCFLSLIRVRLLSDPEHTNPLILLRNHMQISSTAPLLLRGNMQLNPIPLNRHAGESWTKRGCQPNTTSSYLSKHLKAEECINVSDMRTGHTAACEDLAQLQERACPTVNSTLWFHLTFISYANPAARKMFVTGLSDQPSSFVSLLLCQSLEGSFFPSIFPSLFGHVTAPCRR